MKIARVSAHIMSVPHPHLDTPVKNWVFARVETDAGLSGLGEGTVDWHELAVARMIDSHMGPSLIGKDPTRVEDNWTTLRRGFFWRDGVVASAAISALDMALWDITGKAYGLPVYKLLGGAVRDRVRIYARGDLGLATAADELGAAVDEGYEAFKMGLVSHNEPQFDEQGQVQWIIDAMLALRRQAGPLVDLMVDGIGNLSLQGASAMVQGLKPMRPLFVEEPVNADSPQNLIDLRRANPDIRIAAGERLMSRWAFREWLEKGAIDVAQPDTSYACGISEVLKIARYAEVYNVVVALHNSCGPVATAAAAHAAAAMSNFLILEHCRLPPWTNRVQKHGPLIRGGCIELGDSPGLGIELDFDVIEANPYRSLPLVARQARYRDRWGAHSLI